MKKQFVDPELEVVELEDSNIVAASGCECDMKTNIGLVISDEE